MKNYIFGARATAAGFYKALSVLHPEIIISAFIVSKLDFRNESICGCPIKQLDSVSWELSGEEKESTHIYVAVPELIHDEIKKLLNQYGFMNLTMLDSRSEADIMERFFNLEGHFKSVHSLKSVCNKNIAARATIYASSFYKDKPLINDIELPKYVKKLFIGCDTALNAGVSLTGRADYYDNTGDNISLKNPNRCEMTAHYWVWKNRLDTDDEYVGIYHYRRILDLSDSNIVKIKQNNVDVVLPFPMIHYPNSRIQHTWYVKESDWEVMIKVLSEMYPTYVERFDEVFDAPFFYNYNIMLAKKEVFADYCAWLYPILDRIEDLSYPKGADRADRYTAYLSESLTTLYFMLNLNNLRIYHTGRLLLT